MSRIVIRAASFIKGKDFEWKSLIPPLKARRMGTLMKRTVVSSLQALNMAELEKPDAIVTATTLGCMEETEIFLRDMTSGGEQLLSPTHFMQSTHNTLSSLVAIWTGCHGYNCTYSHGRESLSGALLDAFLLLKEGKVGSVLVGCHDEKIPLVEAFDVSDSSLAIILESDSTGGLCVLEDIGGLAPMDAEEFYGCILEGKPYGPVKLGRL